MNVRANFMSGKNINLVSYMYIYMERNSSHFPGVRKYWSKCNYIKSEHAIQNIHPDNRFT